LNWEKMKAREGIPDINRNPQQPDERSAMSAPPPPTEVKIRTMKSDIAGLAASGGGLPRFQNIKVSGLSLEKGIDTPEAVHRNNALLTVVITIVAFILLGIIGYFGYRIYTGAGI
jgi:hypothetical protein